MKVISTCLVLVLMFSVAAVYAGVQGPPPQQAQGEKALAIEGTLVKVDANAKMLAVKGADDKDWVFAYTDATQVTGPEKNIQGLAAKSGAKLKITYRVEQGKNVATRIDVAPEK